ncbi:pyridoxamine 5'-phosphate oxidase, partial [Aphelenchoides avenae]
VRIEGTVEKLPLDVADEYWKSRPLASRIGAKVAQQGSVIPSREFLDEKRKELEKLAAERGEDAITRPETWGGYVLKPTHFEFWQGQPNRLHDRIIYEKSADGKAWTTKRLSP